MSVRSVVGTLLACFAATVLAITSLDRVCTWLVDDAGGTTRAAVMLANAPLFGAGTFTSAVTETLPNARDAGRAIRRQSPNRATTHDSAPR